MKINICADKLLLYSQCYTLEVGLLSDHTHHSMVCLGFKLACVLGTWRSSWESELIWQAVLMLWLITVGHFGKSATFWLFLLYSSHHCACTQPFSPPYSHVFCSVKHGYDALTRSTCSWPKYRKLWVSNFHLQERSDTFVCCNVTTLLLWSFTLWTVNCSSTPGISFFGCL